MENIHRYREYCDYWFIYNLKATTAKNIVRKLKKRLMTLLPKMAPAHFSKQEREAWPGRQKGKSRWKITTGWCQPIQWGLWYINLYDLSQTRNNNILLKQLYIFLSDALDMLSMSRTSDDQFQWMISCSLNYQKMHKIREGLKKINKKNKPPPLRCQKKRGLKLLKQVCLTLGWSSVCVCLMFAYRKKVMTYSDPIVT